MALKMTLATTDKLQKVIKQVQQGEEMDDDQGLGLHVTRVKRTGGQA